MQNTSMPVVLITGATSGIGYACAKVLFAEGYRVYGTSREPAGKDLGFRLRQMCLPGHSRNTTGCKLIQCYLGKVFNRSCQGLPYTSQPTSKEEKND
jgi:GDP-D-mannose dehydratase